MSRNSSERTLQNTENSPKCFLIKLPYQFGPRDNPSLAGRLQLTIMAVRPPAGGPKIVPHVPRALWYPGPRSPRDSPRVAGGTRNNKTLGCIPLGEHQGRPLDFQQAASSSGGATGWNRGRPPRISPEP